MSGYLFRSRRATVRRLERDGVAVMRLELTRSFFPRLSDDLNPSEAATLGAVLLGFATTQDGPAATYANAVIAQLANGLLRRT